MSFSDFRDQVITCLGSNPVLSEIPETTGPIYPGLVWWPSEESGASPPFWRLIGVSADGRMLDISGLGESAQLKCARCGSEIRLDLNFQHAGDSDCYRLLGAKPLYDVRVAFLRWAVIRGQLMMSSTNPEEDSKPKFESLLVELSGSSLGHFEDWENLLAWSRSEFWVSGERDAARTGSNFAICEGIIKRLNDFLLTLPEVWQSGLFCTVSPPSDDIFSALREVLWWQAYIRNRR